MPDNVHSSNSLPYAGLGGSVLLYGCCFRTFSNPTSPTYTNKLAVIHMYNYTHTHTHRQTLPRTLNTAHSPTQSVYAPFSTGKSNKHVLCSLFIEYREKSHLIWENGT